MPRPGRRGRLPGPPAPGQARHRAASPEAPLRPDRGERRPCGRPAAAPPRPPAPRRAPAGRRGHAGRVWALRRRSPQPRRPAGARLRGSRPGRLIGPPLSGGV
ncbi:hypothetical protein FXF51_20835 [Nonomuraea sp. PA05]|nr:hypothetical protein FXF51_20835 [Nonomuraea sp. PA05]